MLTAFMSLDSPIDNDSMARTLLHVRFDSLTITHTVTTHIAPTRIIYTVFIKRSWWDSNVTT